MHKDERMNEVLKFWFGRVEETIIPSEHRAKIWFGESAEVDQQIKDAFSSDLMNAMLGRYDSWTSTAHGQLALIILFDQFSRHIYRDLPSSIEQDEKAVKICLAGIDEKVDHQLSLIERVFYYFPLLHSESIEHQHRSVEMYASLVKVAFPETRVIFDSFFKFANHHYSIIERFGRFPLRNDILNRKTTDSEQAYINQVKE